MENKYWDRFLHILAGITLGWMLFGCGAVQRHDRLVRKYPFVHTDKIDTIRDTLRITIPEVRIDTVFHLDQLYDTIFVDKDRLQVKVYRVRDSIYVTAKCDTIYKEKIITRPYKVVEHSRNTIWNEIRSLLWVLGIILLLLILLQWMRQRMRL